MAQADMTIIDTERNNQDKKRIQEMRRHYGPLVAQGLKLQVQAKRAQSKIDKMQSKEYELVADVDGKDEGV